MINIAICDDDVAITAYVEDMLFKMAKLYGVKINCEVFFDGSTLVDALRHSTYYDLIYLDIEMPKVNGINTAEIIRNMGIPALIVYVSSYEKYLKELFDTEPFRFLSKPIDTNMFNSVFLAACKRIQQKSGYFSFSYNKLLVKIPLNSIYYFESQNRVIYVRTAEHIPSATVDADNNENKFYGKINEVEKTLYERNVRFIRIHQSFLVNFDYIKTMNFTSVTMSNGTVLQISEDRQKNVRTQFCILAGMEAMINE